MKWIIHLSFLFSFALIATFAFVATSCGSDSPDSAPDSGSADSDTDSDTDADSDSDSDSDSDHCADLIQFFQSCGAPAQEVTELDEICEAMDDALVDPFVGSFVECLTGYECEDFSEADGGPAQEDPFDLCFIQAVGETSPPQANQDLIQAYCEYMTGCDTSWPMQDCMDELSDGIFFLYLEASHVADLMSCLDGEPTCAQGASVESCLNGVLDGIEFLSMVDDE